MVRRWLRFAALVGAMLACVPLHYLWRLLRIPSPWPRRFLFAVGYIAGLRIKVEGSYRRTHTLFVANHSSWLDIMAIGGTAGAAFVAKAELAQIGFIKWMADFNDTIYIQRQDRKALHGQVDTVRESLARGRAVCIFPEATTKGGKDVLPFRPSLLSSLYPPMDNVVVQPVALDFGDIADDVAWGDETGGVNFKRIFSRPGTIPLTMHYLEPLTPGPDGDRKVIAAAARDAIVRALNASDAASPGL